MWWKCVEAMQPSEFIVSHTLLCTSHYLFTVYKSHVNRSWSLGSPWSTQLKSLVDFLDIFRWNWPILRDERQFQSGTFEIFLKSICPQVHQFVGMNNTISNMLQLVHHFPHGLCRKLVALTLEEMLVLCCDSPWGKCPEIRSPWTLLWSSLAYLRRHLTRQLLVEQSYKEERHQL